MAQGIRQQVKEAVTLANQLTVHFYAARGIVRRPAELRVMRRHHLQPLYLRVDNVTFWGPAEEGANVQAHYVNLETGDVYGVKYGGPDLGSYYGQIQDILDILEGLLQAQADGQTTEQDLAGHLPHQYYPVPHAYRRAR